MSKQDSMCPRVDLDDEPFWPAVQWGAAAIVVLGLLLVLPGVAWLMSLVGA
ncbi:hypothetical protein [Phenylobacterium sp.]|uniref:hypothetical protein n=1 Tax=Phenylobacterium sp. TaxID=1871053 RepID=UPI0025EA5894|nr:hypothetical protein [Phenylobacterium sp.]